MADLLGDLAELRRRAREDRHAYSFPLLFFGVASFLAVPLHAPGSASRGFDVRHPVALGVYWTAVLVVGGLATVWWYRGRGARVGIETSTEGYLGALAIGLGGPVVGLALDHLPFRFSSGTAVGLIVLAAATVLWRWKAPRAATLTAAVLGTAVLQHDQPAIGQFIAIGLGLVVLAAVERSTRFTTITAAYLVALCVSAGFTPLEGVTPSTWSLGSVVVLPGLVLVVGGLAGLRRG
ncbi:hypothetical protein IOD16_31695 [Saccharothrix sp. 6-C]|uniref:hypothetical protein n=1 Tax=Saccharothrix sp. 6-C TaxID=2781735 RepID=UPI00191730CA|nr:hypothetical protein [Saccharothrix sp. 6-C]QQQ75609.1 hypothetical protein IOD16_31695 [Saccharothrix sp. 6-C]